MRECMGIAEKASQSKCPISWETLSHTKQETKRQAKRAANAELWGGRGRRSRWPELWKVRGKGVCVKLEQINRTLVPICLRIHGIVRATNRYKPGSSQPDTAPSPDQPSASFPPECHQSGKKKAQKAKAHLRNLLCTCIYLQAYSICEYIWIYIKYGPYIHIYFIHIFIYIHIFVNLNL